jgi:hypothetical protein
MGQRTLGGAWREIARWLKSERGGALRKAPAADREQLVDAAHDLFGDARARLHPKFDLHQNDPKIGA